MILNQIKEKLTEIDPKVFYGMVDPSIRETVWDYIVFDRKSLKPNASKTGYTEKYSVHIIREEYIPEGLELEVIDKMLEIDGVKLSGDDGIYTYVQKPNTNIVVEMFSVDFIRAKKV